jgi:hypothetical protein
MSRVMKMGEAASEQRAVQNDSIRSFEEGNQEAWKAIQEVEGGQQKETESFEVVQSEHPI